MDSLDTIYDYKRYAVLYVDDEELSLKYFSRAFGDKFRILTATNAQDGFRLLEDHQDEIGVVMSDQRMPGEKGVQFLERARQLRPRIIRILATAFADLEAAIEAVNAGAIYKYVTKPWDVPLLEATLRRSLEFFIVQTERDLLLREKLSTVHRMVITDRVLSLGVLAAGLGHQLRNTMDAVRMFLELTPEMLHRENLDLNQLRHPTFWQDFHRTVQQRVRLILDHLTDLAEGASGPFRFDTEVRLKEAVDAAASQLAPELAQRRIEVTNQIDPALPPLRVDGVRFGKLFSLLLRDELCNLQEGGIVRFEAALHPAGDGRPAEVELLVTDNGPGVPPDAILSLFDPFVTRKERPQEYGINLMACYFVVYHHGGRIQVRQGPERGLGLTITLPLQPPPVAPGNEADEFLVRAMTNERLWERLLAGI